MKKSFFCYKEKVCLDFHVLGFLTSVLVPVDLKPVSRIRIRRICMFLGLLDPHPDPLITSTDPAPDHSIKKNGKKNLDFYCFVISLWLLTSVLDPDPLDRGTDRRIRIRIRTKKCHGSTTLVWTHLTQLPASSRTSAAEPPGEVGPASLQIKKLPNITS
jgi:hypothetical protein